MAQFYSDNTPVANIEYNDLPDRAVEYETSKEKNTRTGIAKWVDDISASVANDIIKPTLKNLATQFVDMLSNNVKASINNKIGGGNSYQNYSNPYNNGYYGNATYNPNAYADRFNTNDGFVHSNPAMGVKNTAPIAEPWHDIAFVRKVDGEIAKNNILDWLSKKGKITVHDFCYICHKDVDWSWNNYGWYDLSSMRVRYNITLSNNMPFDFADIPDPVYLGK